MDNNEIRESQLNLQGLLRFALNYTKNEDAKNPSEIEAIEPERKAFLESALKSMTVDVIAEFEKAIKALMDNGSVSEKLGAFSVIRDYTDNIDFANNFIKVGGSDILLKYMKDEHSELRVNALLTVAEISQNNPFAQKHFVDAGIIPDVVRNIKSDDENVASSSIHLLSALVLHYEPGLIEFLKLGGVSAIIACLQSHRSKVFIKTCFLVATLSANSTDIRDEFVKKSAIPKIASSLDVVRGFDVRVETALYALSELSKSPEWKLSEMEDYKEGLIDVLNKLKQVNIGLPESEEIVAYTNIVLECINSSSRGTEEKPDLPLKMLMIKEK